MKFPGTYAAYAVIMSIFGQTVTGIHLGLLLVNAATVVLIFFLGRQLMNSTVGLAAAMSYAVLSVSPSVLGFAGHATHFVLLPVLGGTLLLCNSTDRQALGRLFASGLLFGIGLLMKQPAVFFALFGAIYLVSGNLHRRAQAKKILLQGLIFSAGVILPLGITCLLLWRIGVFEQVLVLDNRLRASIWRPGSFQSSAANFLLQRKGSACGRLADLDAGRNRTRCGFVGATNTSNRSFSARLPILLCIGAMPGILFSIALFHFGASSCLAACGRCHQQIVGSHYSSISRSPIFLILILGAALAWPILRERKFFFEASPADASRMIYPESPFVESIRIAEYLREQTTPSDTIAVLGSEPQIYFYSNRHSATGYIYTYGLMEPQKYATQMQQEMIREIERARPKFLISVVMPDSWLQRPESERLIFTWANEYTAQNYTVAGFVNIGVARQNRLLL